MNMSIGTVWIEKRVRHSEKYVWLLRGFFSFLFVFFMVFDEKRVKKVWFVSTFFVVVNKFPLLPHIFDFIHWSKFQSEFFSSPFSKLSFYQTRTSENNPDKSAQLLELSTEFIRPALFFHFHCHNAKIMTQITESSKRWHFFFLSLTSYSHRIESIAMKSSVIFLVDENQRAV